MAQILYVGIELAESFVGAFELVQSSLSERLETSVTVKWDRLLGRSMSVRLMGLVK
jgi:hypothetical protein